MGLVTKQHIICLVQLAVGSAPQWLIMMEQIPLDLLKSLFQTTTSGQKIFGGPTTPKIPNQIHGQLEMILDSKPQNFII